MAAPHSVVRPGDRRIGRHLGRYPAASAITVAELLSDEAGRAAGLRISSRLDADQKAHRQKGAYLQRTNCEETDPAQLWRWYIQLMQAEAAFRTAKSDLGLRPADISPQTGPRARPHSGVHPGPSVVAFARTMDAMQRARHLRTTVDQTNR